MQSDVTDDVFNVASGARPLRQLCTMLCAAAEANEPVFETVHKVNPVTRRLADTTNARKHLALAPMSSSARVSATSPLARQSPASSGRTMIPSPGPPSAKYGCREAVRSGCPRHACRFERLRTRRGEAPSPRATAPPLSIALREAGVGPGTKYLPSFVHRDSERSPQLRWHAGFVDIEPDATTSTHRSTHHASLWLSTRSVSQRTSRLVLEVAKLTVSPSSKMPPSLGSTVGEAPWFDEPVHLLVSPAQEHHHR
jgi:hypothetical protein